MGTPVRGGHNIMTKKSNKKEQGKNLAPGKGGGRKKTSPKGIITYI
jgi:hypothetical protein